MAEDIAGNLFTILCWQHCRRWSVRTWASARPDIHILRTCVYLTSVLFSPRNHLHHHFVYHAGRKTSTIFPFNETEGVNGITEEKIEWKEMCTGFQLLWVITFCYDLGVQVRIPCLHFAPSKTSKSFFLIWRFCMPSRQLGPLTTLICNFLPNSCVTSCDNYYV